MIGRNTAMAGGALSLLLFAAAFAQPAPSDQTATHKAVRQACAADVKALCGGVIPGGGRLMQCMKANADKISPACHEALAQERAERAAERAAGATPH